MHHLDSDELEGNVRHGRNKTGHSDSHGQRRMPKTRLHKIGCGKMSSLTASTPEPRHDGKDERVNDDRVRDGEKAIGTDAVNQGRHSDDGVSGVKISTNQEPGNDDTESLAAQRPFVATVSNHPLSNEPPRNPRMVTSKKRPTNTARAIQ